jgi:hypothetical protein
MSRVRAQNLRAVSVALGVAALGACGGNSQPTTTTKSAATSGSVSWPVAQQLLHGCHVKSIEQTHSRSVTLTLRSGATVFAREPQIDEIFRILNRLPHSCQPKTVATE